MPNWIKNGSNEIKRAFLRALFDDEACIVARKKGNSITFAMRKHEKLRMSLREFLEELRHLLSEFNIGSGPVRLRATYEDKKGRQKVEMGFIILRKQNLVAFQKEIGFCHPDKGRKLNNAIHSYSYNV